MTSISTVLLILSPTLVVLTLGTVIVLLQYWHFKERDELTKKLMARNLSEYQQEAVARLQIERKKKEVQPKERYLSLTELENDHEAFERATKNIETNY